MKITMEVTNYSYAITNVLNAGMLEDAQYLIDMETKQLEEEIKSTVEVDFEIVEPDSDS